MAAISGYIIVNGPNNLILLDNTFALAVTNSLQMAQVNLGLQMTLLWNIQNIQGQETTIVLASNPNFCLDLTAGSLSDVENGILGVKFSATDNPSFANSNQWTIAQSTTTDGNLGNEFTIVSVGATGYSLDAGNYSSPQIAKTTASDQNQCWQLLQIQ
jgi:hypothetical protein